MSNLFSVFDPSSWMDWALNWFSAFSVLLILPSLYWTSPSQMYCYLKSLITSIRSEFQATLNSNSVPGFLLLPLSLCLYIMINNALGLLPYVFTASSHFTFTIALALPLWCGHMALAWMSTPQLTLAHLVPLGTPAALMAFMVIIELISSLIRPLTLSVRLAANMVAGHLLLSLLANQAAFLTWGLLSLLLLALILLALLECAVSLIQAYVFSVLSTLYLNEVNSPQIS